MRITSGRKFWNVRIVLTVKAVCNACTACVQGEFVDWANTSSASAMQVANVSKPFLRKRFGGLLRPAELGFEEFCIEMTSISLSCESCKTHRESAYTCGEQVRN